MNVRASARISPVPAVSPRQPPDTPLAGGTPMLRFPLRAALRSAPWLAIPAFVLALSAAPFGQATSPQTRLLRTPTVSASQIAFAYANNIWSVERGGGHARRLTSFQGQTTNPHFSPD